MIERDYDFLPLPELPTSLWEYLEELEICAQQISGIQNEIILPTESGEVGQVLIASKDGIAKRVNYEEYKAEQDRQAREAEEVVSEECTQRTSDDEKGEGKEKQKDI